MNKFSYHRPATLAEALDLLAEHSPRAKVIAGGTDLMVLARKGALNAQVLVSLRRLTDLRYVAVEESVVRIGGLTTLRDLEKSTPVAAHVPALADAVRRMAAVQIRNVATMAGNIVNAAPSADTAPPLLVSDAELTLVSRVGRRHVPVTGFFTGTKRTVIDPGEILTEFRVPLPGGPYGQAFWKHSRRAAMDLAVVSVAVHLELEADLTTCRQARIALGVAGPTPIRTFEAEARLQGKPVTAETLEAAGGTSCEESLCRDSLRGRAWYRQEIIRVMVKRMGLLALERAKARARAMEAKK